ncbi:hypothetical protein IW15_15345 [Chryseobacterium soli]|uniref:Uncharacterized protein n=1 Tax=Chryseobacterium soli TaxID=445961 RepID=A0A086A4G8_9FLAO|nr:tetratricopeptide repeat protein [Chryseobacterium soli]KFF11582.1 hypothetical protein IW15_15345 [Chryseobacterium soli]
MYKFFLTLFLSISLQLSAQVNTQLLSNSSWTRLKNKMVDGSTDLSKESPRFLVWKINGNNFCKNIDPWFVDRNKCINFKLENNVIKLSDKLAYHIETLTADSLVVVEKIDGVTSPDKIRKFWFVKTSVIVKDFADKEKSDSIIINSQTVTPTLTKDIISEMLSVYLKKNYTHDFTLDGEILIFPKKQVVEVKMENKKWTRDNQIGVDLFKNTLQNSFKVWNIAGFEKFEKIIIPYHFYSKVEAGSGNFSFSNKVSDKGNKEIVINIKNKFASSDNFNKGLGAINNQKFDSAIYFFNQAYENDNTNTDALYNIVSIYLAQNKTDAACATLKKLKDLEQTEGIKLYNEKCSEK